MGEDFKVSIKKKDLKNLLKVEYLILLFFISAAVLYINFDKLPLTHPGNLKASDTFAHSLAVEKVIDTQQWNYDDFYLSLGREKMSSVQPPLYYMDAAILTMFSGLPAWVTFYFIVCISQAFFVILMYLITLELFGDKRIAVLASGLAILPLPISVWLYPVYIGIWIQVCGFSLIMAFFWLFIRYLKRRESWSLLFMGICISSLILTHSADILLLFFPCIVLGIIILMQAHKKKDLRYLMKNALLLGLIPTILILALLPKFLFVWKGYAGDESYLPRFQFTTTMFDQSNIVASQVFPLYTNIPLWQIIISMIAVMMVLVGRSVMIRNDKGTKIIIKKHPYDKSWLYLAIYFFIFVYFAEFFLYRPYYIGRMRALQPYMLYPLLALGLFSLFELVKGIAYSLLIQASKTPKKASSVLDKSDGFIKSSFIVLMILLCISSAWAGYRQQVEVMRYEHVSLGQWQSYQWIGSNVKKDEKILFFGSHDQSEGLYSKRINGIFSHQEFQDYLKTVTQDNISTDFHLSGWGGATPRSKILELGFWRYEKIPDLDKDVSLYDFNYVYFMDELPGMKQVNDFFISYFQTLGFRLVYDISGYRVLKNEN
jgi:hypothetical protein